ncbi:RNA12 protein-domain-containing protein [Dipodascopsis uninucleata]
MSIRLLFGRAYGTSMAHIRPKLSLRVLELANVGRVQQCRAVSYTKLVAMSGVLGKSENEGLLYIDNAYPMCLHPYDPRQMFIRLFISQDLYTTKMDLQERLIPKDLPITLNEVVPRWKDGAVIVKYKRLEDVNETEIEERIQNHIEEKEVRPWFNPLQKFHCFSIRGSPWVEDLRRFPSNRLRIEFEGPDVDQAELFCLLRRYGPIRDIIPLPASSKDLPRYATVIFSKLRSATSARNCLHGLVTGSGTKLHIYYEPRTQKNVIRDMIVNHPRIFIPLFAALLAAFTVAVFDPIRTYFVKRKITNCFVFLNSTISAWIKSTTKSTMDALAFVSSLGKDNLASQEEAELQLGFSDRRDLVKNLNTLLDEAPESFIVVSGPRGSGKADLVQNHVLKTRPNKLVLDCQALVATRSEAAFFNEVSNQIGYFPIFPWMNSISNWMDIAAQGLIGQKVGFSEDSHVQFRNMLENATSALKQIASEKLREVQSERKKNARGAPLPPLAADMDVFESKPNDRPVIVIENFLNRSEQNERMYRILAEWSAVLVSSKLAQVVFITDDTGYQKILTEAMPNEVINTITVGDATPELARKFVLLQVRSITGKTEDEIDDKYISDLDRALEPLGGRMTDLISLVHRISIGESNLAAADEMIKLSASEIIKRFLRPSRENRSWSVEQVWSIINLLADHDVVKYNEFYLNPLFKTETAETLMALEHCDLITVLEKDGRPYAVKAGRPIYRAAFKRLLEDKSLSANMNLNQLTALAKIDKTTIQALEDELAVLSQISQSAYTTRAPVQDINERIAFLSRKIKESQLKICDYETRMTAMKQIITSNY